MTNYFLTPKAEQDLDEIAQYIARDNMEAALRLYNRARETFENLLFSPLIGSPYPTHTSKLEGLRFLPIKDYSKYLAFYLTENGNITVIRVLHGARNIRLII